MRRLFYNIYLFISFLISKAKYNARPVIDTLEKIEEYKSSDYSVIIISGIVGIVIGFFVYLFHLTMEFAESFFTFIRVSATSYLGWYLLIIPLIPALGGLIVGLMRKWVFKSINVDNLDTVVNSIINNHGKIDWRNAFKSIIFAGATIGSGGGGGREGPTIALGASIGSSLAQLIGLRKDSRRVLCGAGAAAAISGIFNAPLGGIVFALEAVIGDVGLKSFVPIVISSVMSTAVSRIFLGDSPLLTAPPMIEVRFLDYLYLAVLGVLSGFVAVYFIKTYNATCNSFKKRTIKLPELLRPVIGGFIVGILLMLLPTLLETTYNPINYAISWQTNQLAENSIFSFFTKILTIENVALFGLLAAFSTILLKPISAALTISSGGAGGAFAPSIKVGAMFGFCFGYGLHLISPGASPGLFATVAAGAVLAGTYQLPLAAGIICFEITKNPELLLPLIYSSVISSFIVQKLGLRTFNPFQKETVVDESRLHPVLKEFDNQ